MKVLKRQKKVTRSLEWMPAINAFMKAVNENSGTQNVANAYFAMAEPCRLDTLNVIWKLKRRVKYAPVYQAVKAIPAVVQDYKSLRKLNMEIVE